MKITITTLILGILITLIIGSGAGYSFGKGANDNGSKTKELQDSITMMNEQSASIQSMAAMMKSYGVIMQEMGIEYKNNEMISSGKDLEMFGAKYIKEDAGSISSGPMKDMMGN